MPPSHETSRVLTLVFTDLADSTNPQSQDRELVAGLAEDCGGRCVDWVGGESCLAFETSSAGVMFALRLQQARADDDALPGARIGLHMGEVTEKAGPSGPDSPRRVAGLAVDLAARVQGLAKPGQILMSSAVYEEVRQKLGVDAVGSPILWHVHGDYTFDGFDDPVEICKVGLEGISRPERPEASREPQPLDSAFAELETPFVELSSPDVPSPLRRYLFIALFFAAVIGVTLGTDFIAGLLTGQ